jgi:hypothetical protein
MRNVVRNRVQQRRLVRHALLHVPQLLLGR